MGKSMTVRQNGNRTGPKRVIRTAFVCARRGQSLRPLAATAAVLMGVACGGEGGVTQPPPPPPPPPPGPPPPAVNLAPSLGQVVTLTDAAEVRAFQLDAASSAREYHVIIESAVEDFSNQGAPIPYGVSTAMRLQVTGSAPSSNVVVREVPSLSKGVEAWLPLQLQRRQRSFIAEDQLREATRRELERVGATPARPRVAGPGPRFSVVSAPPNLGDMLTFRQAIQGNLFPNCNSTATITGEVMYVGQSFVVVEDVQLAGNFSSEDYQTVGQRLDDVIYPIVSAYFGDPGDLDNNERVIALVTAEVNKLTPRGSSTFIAGFFWAGDYSSTSECPASNEGELFYLIGPDPNGDFSDPVAVEDAIELVETTVAHELVHLLNTAQRIVIPGSSSFSRLEHTWLDEGLAHLAEEVSGFGRANLGTRSNFDLDAVAFDQPTVDAFNVYHRLNLFRFARFMYDGPHTTMAFGDASGNDPSSGQQSLRMRGFGYGLARWLGDHYGPSGNGVLPGSREELLFRELSSGGPAFLKGTQNVERAIVTAAGQSVTWSEILSLYLASLAVDDNGPAGLDPRAQWKTWDLRGLFDDLRMSNLGSSAPFDRTYPLQPTVISLGETTNQASTFTVNGATGRYFVLRTGSTAPRAVLEVTTQVGANLPPGARAQVTIIRTI